MPIVLGIVFGFLFGLHDNIVAYLQEAFRNPVVYNYGAANSWWKGLKLVIVGCIGLCLWLFPIVAWWHILSMYFFYYVAFEISFNIIKFRKLSKWNYISRSEDAAGWDKTRVELFGSKAEVAEIFIKLTIIVAGILFYVL